MVTAPGRAQDTGVIAGTVIDVRTQEPLADINVVVAGTLFGATTGPDGRFRIEDIPPDTYTVQVSALDYRTARRSVDVPSGETVQITFRLTPSAQRMAEEEVTPESEALQPRGHLDSRALRELNTADPGMTLRRLPGTGAARGGALGFAPNVRGLSGGQLAVYVDGVRSFTTGPLRMDSPLSHIDPTAIERIEVVKGPYALTQGAGTMSAILVETPAFEQQATKGQLEGGFQGNGQVAETAGSMSGAFAGTPFRVQAAYRTGQNYEAGNGQTVPARYESGAVHGRVDVPLTPVSRLSVRGNFQDQRDVSEPGRLLDAAFFKSGYGAVQYRLDRGTGLTRRIEAQAYAMQALHAMDNDERPTAIPDGVPSGQPLPTFDMAIDAELQNVGGRLAARIAPAAGFLVTVGADAYHLYRSATRSFEAFMRAPVTDAVWPGVTITDFGVFANGTRALGPIDASGTVRLDLVRTDANRVRPAFLQNAGGLSQDDLSASEANWSGAFTLSTDLTPQWTLSAGVGSVVRTADAFERYADRFPLSTTQTSAEYQGNPILDPERSTQGDIWLRGELDRWQVQLSGFARRIDNYIMLAPTPIDPLLPASPVTVYRYVNGTATFYGGEVSGRFVVNPLLSLNGRASYLWGQNQTREEPVLGIMPLSANLGFRVQAPFNEDLFLDGTVHLAATQDRAATTLGEMPTDGYATLDLRLGFAPAERTSLIFSIENVTDAYYVNHLNARTPFNAESVSTPFSGTDLPEPGRTVGINLRVRF